MVQRPADGVGEDEVVLLPFRSRVSALGGLPDPVVGEGLDGDGDTREQDLPARRLGLELPDQVHGPRCEVHVRPSQPEQLTLAHPGGDRQDVERFEAVAIDRPKEGLRLVGREDMELEASSAWRRDGLGDVALHEAPPHRVAERMVEDPVELEHGTGRQPGLEPVRVELLEMERAQAREALPADGRQAVEPDQGLVALPGRGRHGPLDALEPGLEELLDRDLLVDGELAGAVAAERLGDLLGSLSSGLAVEVFAMALAVLPAEVGDGDPAPVLAFGDRTLARLRLRWTMITPPRSRST